MPYRIAKSSFFQEWYASCKFKEQMQIQKHLFHIEHDGHFGDHKHIDDNLWELKWLNGRRIYYFIYHDLVVLLFGGNKNGQTHDIQQTRHALKKYIEEKGISFLKEDVHLIFLPNG